MQIDYLPQGPNFASDSDGERAFTSSAEEETYRTKLLRWRSSAREEALQTYRECEELKNIPKYIGALSGSYWSARRAKYKSSFFDNRMGKARIDSLAVLTDTHPTIDVKTAVKAYEEHAKIAHGIIRHEWLTQDMDLSLVMATDISMLEGTAFWKLGAALPGNLQALPCGIENVMPIQPGFHIQQSTAVMYRTWKSLQKIKRKFPFTSENLDREFGSVDSQYTSGSPQYNRPDWVDEYVWNGLSSGMQRAMGVKAEPDRMVEKFFRTGEVEEFYVDDDTRNDSNRPVLMRHPYLSLSSHNWWYWVKPGEMLYPRKRLIVFAGRTILYDGPSPFWHGLYPFSTLRLNPVPWSFWGMSKYRDLLPVNSAINEIIAAMLDMVKKALNPQAISKQGSVNPAAWAQFFSDMPGTKLLMGPNSNPAADIRYMQAPEIPAYVLNLLTTVLIPEFDRLAGAIDAGRLGSKKQVPGGETIEQMKDLQNTGTRLEGRFLEAFLRDSGIISLSNVFQYYTLPQRLKILGDDGISRDDLDSNPTTMVPDEVMPKEDHWKNFAFSVAPGSLHSGSKDREKTVAITMQRAGQLSLRGLWRKLEMEGESERLWQELMEEHKAGMGMAGGRQPRSAAAKKGGM